ncbi:hypothetical protein, partial [Leuconostoc suionicum]
LSFHNIKKLLYLIISDYALEIKRSGFSVYEHFIILTAIMCLMTQEYWIFLEVHKNEQNNIASRR